VVSRWEVIPAVAKNSCVVLALSETHHEIFVQFYDQSKTNMWDKITDIEASSIHVVQFPMRAIKQAIPSTQICPSAGTCGIRYLTVDGFGQYADAVGRRLK
jgi:hypothetical protein